MNRSLRPRPRRLTTVPAVATAATLPLAGCSSGTGGKKAEESASDVSAGSATTPRMTVAMITRAVPGDTFWDTIRKGAQPAMKDAVAKAEKAGIPVVGFNSGVDDGQVALEARCAGVEKTFSGRIQVLYVNGADTPSVRSTITAKLKRDTSIDEVVTLGAPVALTAVQAVSDAGSKAKTATYAAKGTR
ncbi:hypothetical protein OK074_1420 [Actinobacteria bacterium OK074]|nr:hypothetical protein OK074_1420 [Actinobacteria bacterium OK074]